MRKKINLLLFLFALTPLKLYSENVISFGDTLKDSISVGECKTYAVKCSSYVDLMLHSLDVISDSLKTYVYDSDSTTLVDSSLRTVPCAPTVSPGKYYLIIKNIMNHPKKLNYQIGNAKDVHNDITEKEPNNDSLHADSIEFNTDVVGMFGNYSSSIKAKDTVDWYKVVIDKYGSFNIGTYNSGKFATDMDMGVNFYSYPTMKHLVGGRAYAGEVQSYGYLSKGQYLIKFNRMSVNGEYKFKTLMYDSSGKCTESEPNNSINEADIINVSDTVYGWLLDYDSVLNEKDTSDWYIMEAKNDGLISLNCLPSKIISSKNPICELYGGEKHFLLATVELQSGKNCEIGQIYKGIYYLKICRVSAGYAFSPIMDRSRDTKVFKTDSLSDIVYYSSCNLLRTSPKDDSLIISGAQYCNDRHNFLSCALRFNGSHRVDSKDTLPEKTMSTYTVSFWAYLNPYSTMMDYGTLIAIGVTRNDNPSFSVRTDLSGGMEIHSEDQNNQSIYSIPKATVNQWRSKWVHFIITRNSNENTLFVNGVKIADIGLRTIINAGKVTLGALNNRSMVTWGFYGKIDEVVILNRALTEAEISNMIDYTKVINNQIATKNKVSKTAKVSCYYDLLGRINGGNHLKSDKTYIDKINRKKVVSLKRY